MSLSLYFILNFGGCCDVRYRLNYVCIPIDCQSKDPKMTLFKEKGSPYQLVSNGNFQICCCIIYGII
jgi:hypothetical protein